MNVIFILLGIVLIGILSLAAINFYLLSLVRKLEQELDELENPF